MATSQQYARQMQALLPTGDAWARQDGTTLQTLLLGMADELGRLDQRALQALVESDPRTALELLTDWERITNLPDPGTSVDQTVQARGQAVAARLGKLGGQSAAYFISLAASLGYTVTVTEFHPFLAGFSNAGDDLTDDAWALAWRVNAPSVTVQYFNAGEGSAGEPLASWGNEVLESALNRVKPAHTVLLFGYNDE